ncbi:MAG: hypothetical protein ACK4YQ_09640 [Phenylobacterium sp.]|uniref:hypothetical protein n=1 Tax=Phenylobacterium sp. TaxID=1871053 RepID=UPI00391B40B3
MVLRLTTEQNDLLSEMAREGLVRLALGDTTDAAARRRTAAEGLREAGLLRRADTIEDGVRRRDYVLTGAGIVALRRRGHRLGVWTEA